MEILSIQSHSPSHIFSLLKSMISNFVKRETYENWEKHKEKFIFPAVKKILGYIEDVRVIIQGSLKTFPRAYCYDRLIKKRFAAASWTRQNTKLWSPRYSRGIMVSYAEATWQACLSKRFFSPLLSARHGHESQLPCNSNTSIHSATSYSSSVPALSLCTAHVSIISLDGKLSYRKIFAAYDTICRKIKIIFLWKISSIIGVAIK